MGLFILQTVLPLAVLQVLFFVLFIEFGKYSIETMDITKYPNFQNVHVFIFMGFGYLFTFLKRYGYSSVGFNLVLSSLSIQWAILCSGFTNLDSTFKFEVGIINLYQADMATVVVLISMGAVLGRTNFFQLIIMSFIEIAVYSLNIYICTTFFEVKDPGLAMFVHMFGAYFGLAVSFVINFRRQGSSDSSLNGSIYPSNRIFAMIGTLFLWIYWPTFNNINMEGDAQRRAIINTYVALASCTVTSFAVSSLITAENKFNMDHIQNATLAAGVGIGSIADLEIQPWGALLVGIISGIIAILGWRYVTPFFEKNCKILDSCGVHNVHGMPGFLSGVLSIVYTFIIFDETTLIYSGNTKDALRQAYGLFITLGIAISSGILTGGLLSFMPVLPGDFEYDDAYHWKIPE